MTKSERQKVNKDYYLKNQDRIRGKARERYQSKAATSSGTEFSDSRPMAPSELKEFQFSVAGDGLPFGIYYDNCAPSLWECDFPLAVAATPRPLVLLESKKSDENQAKQELYELSEAPGADEIPGLAESLEPEKSPVGLEDLQESTTRNSQRNLRQLSWADMIKVAVSSPGIFFRILLVLSISCLLTIMQFFQQTAKLPSITRAGDK